MDPVAVFVLAQVGHIATGLFAVAGWKGWEWVAAKRANGNGHGNGNGFRRDDHDSLVKILGALETLHEDSGRVEAAVGALRVDVARLRGPE